MRYMGLAMIVVVALLAAATGMEALAADRSLWMVALAGGLDGLGGGAVLELLGAARG